MADALGKTLRVALEAKQALIVPGAGNALAARVIEDLGFQAAYVSGAGVTNMFLGLPDLGFISLTQLAEHTAAMRDAVSIPLIVDADTGFGNALNVRQSVRVLERAGANAIQIEDQVMPKRCGHFSGKDVEPVDEMVSKIKAAVDARVSGDLLVIARTDARAIHGFDAAMDRAARMIEAGADLTFVEAPLNVGEIEAIASRLSVPQVTNMVIGGKTPIVDHGELVRMGYGMVLYANAALQGALTGMQQVLGELKEKGRLDEGNPLIADFRERQRIVRKPLFDALDARYSSRQEDR